MPFEAPWKAVIEWLGITKEEIIKILPNLGSFPKTMLLEKNEVFVEKARVASECEGDGEPISCIPLDEGIFTTG